MKLGFLTVFLVPCLVQLVRVVEEKLKLEIYLNIAPLCKFALSFESLYLIFESMLEQSLYIVRSTYLYLE